MSQQAVLARHRQLQPLALAVLQRSSFGEEPLADQVLRVLFRVAHGAEAAGLVAVVPDRLAAAVEEMLEMAGGVGEPLLAPAGERALEAALGFVEDQLSLAGSGSLDFSSAGGEVWSLADQFLVAACAVRVPP